MTQVWSPGVSIRFLELSSRLLNYLLLSNSVSNYVLGNAVNVKVPEGFSLNIPRDTSTDTEVLMNDDLRGCYYRPDLRHQAQR